MTDPQALAAALQAGDRRALARAITLVESARDDHRAQALALLDALAQSPRRALRIGLSGTPGVGKSSFIERFGLMLIGQGLRVAVLAVDPSSVRSGGSILGDKTRMELLSRHPAAFIRPSPSQAALGGVARRSREAVTLCEAAGFDVILIETVGVGQSEITVAGMADLFLLLLAPAGGDELQGVKRGIMEMADLILVNKADGDLKPAALRTVADYAGALRLLRKRPQDPPGFPKALPVSAVTGEGLAEAWAATEQITAFRRAGGIAEDTRRTQALGWFDDALRAGLMERLSGALPQAEALREEVAQGRIAPAVAAARALEGGRRLVELRTYALKPGTGAEFAEIMERESLPLLRAAGIRILHAALDEAGSDTYLLIRAFVDAADKRARLEAFYASPEWRQGPREAIVSRIVTAHEIDVTLPESLLTSPWR